MKKIRIEYRTTQAEGFRTKSTEFAWFPLDVTGELGDRKIYTHFGPVRVAVRFFAQHFREVYRLRICHFDVLAKPTSRQPIGVAIMVCEVAA
jgi:hypothetical protein